MVEPEGLRCRGGAPLSASPRLSQILPRYFGGVTSSGSEDTEIPDMQILTLWQVSLVGCMRWPLRLSKP